MDFDVAHRVLIAKYQQLNISMRFYEFKSSQPKPLTPAQARIKALKDQAKRAQAAVKAERARQKIQAAQSTLNQLENNAMESKTFRALHKPNNPYSAWIGTGTYGSFNDARRYLLGGYDSSSFTMRQLGAVD